MRSTQVLVCMFACFICIAYVNAHGFMGIPRARDETYAQPSNLWQRYMPFRNPMDPLFQCRGWDKPVVPPPTTIKAGSNFTFWFGEHAPHVGPCYFYIGDSLKNQWFKVLEFQDCGTTFGGKPGQATTPNLKNVTLPDWVPACEACVLRWEWHALHQRSVNGGSVEWYTQCADVTIVSANLRNCRVNDFVSIPGHVPTDPNAYWYPYNTGSGMIPFRHTLPTIAKPVCDGETVTTPVPSVTTSTSPVTSTYRPISTTTVMSTPLPTPIDDAEIIYLKCQRA